MTAGHAGHDEHVADAEARRLGDRVLDELGALPECAPCAAAPALRSLGLIALEHAAAIARGSSPIGTPNALRDGVGGDVVVRRADAPGREHIVVAVRAAR